MTHYRWLQVLASQVYRGYAYSLAISEGFDRARKHPNTLKERTHVYHDRRRHP